MSINLTSGHSAINTGVNIMDNDKKSPTIDNLRPRAIASVAPNQDQVMDDLENTEVSGVPVESPVVPVEAPVVPTDIPETPVDSPVDTLAPLETSGSLSPAGEPPQVTVPSSTPEDNSDIDPFANALQTNAYKPKISDADPFGNTVKSKSAYQSPINKAWEVAKSLALLKFTGSMVDNPLFDSDDESLTAMRDNTNRLAYGGVKGLAGTADLASVPLWGLGHVLVGGQKFPFTSMLEEYYPEKAYQFEDDPDSVTDEILRMSQTGLEFLSGGGLVNVTAKAASKGAYTISMSSDLSMSGLAAVGYQGALEFGASDSVALLTSFLAPSGPEITKAFYKVATKGAYNTGVKPVLWVFDKTTSVLPVTSLIKASVKTSGNDWLQARKHELADNPEMWTGSFWSRRARQIVMNTPDKVKSIEEQKREIESITRWVNSAFPNTPETRAHVDRMKALQDTINKDLPEDQQIAFTLEQIFNPLVKKNGMEDGLKQVMISLRITNGKAYDEQLRKNHEALYTYLAKNKETLGPEETKAFTAIFDTHLDEITQLQESVYRTSSSESLINQVQNTGYEFTTQPVAAELRPALVEVRGLLGKAYDSMLERLPKDVELDTTPLKDAVLEVYENLGLFADPKSMPPYVRDIVKALVKTKGDDASSATFTQLQNEASEVGIAINKINRELRETSQLHKKALAEFDVNDKEGLAALKMSQDEAFLEIQGRHSELLQKQKQLSIDKRSTKQNVASEIESLPEPNLVTVGDIREGLKVINGKMRKAYDAENFEQYEILSKVRDGLSKSMEGLKDVDEAAHALFETTNNHYTRFVATDFNESIARKLTAKGNHLFKITSDEAVDLVWENAGTEDIQRFLRNFDGTRDGLGKYMDNILTPESSDIKAIDAYSKEAEKAVGALKDIVYTSLARQINKIDMDPTMDPALRMERIKKVLIDYQHRHKAKLDQIPGLEGLSEDITGTISNLSGYRQAIQVLEDRKKLSILHDVVGPGRSISNIIRDRGTAEEMYEFLTNKLPKVDVDGSGKLRVAEATANEIRRTLRQSLINEYTKDGAIDHKGLEGILATGTDSRNNLSLVLGEKEVLKLDSLRLLGAAMAEGKTKFTEILTDDTTLRGLEKLGLPLGRIGSLLQRRAVFTPSGGYIAGAVATKVLNSMGSKNTSRAMQLLLDRPFDVLNLDQILIREMRDLPAHKAAMLKNVMEGDTSHMRELGSWLPKQLSKHVQAQMAYLGFEMSQSEAIALVEEVLYEDPRHPEFNKPKAGPKEESKEEPKAWEKYGIREDGAKKQKGFLGELPISNGGVMTELSFSVGIDGEEISMPAIVPTLTKEEIKHLQETQEITPEIQRKAIEHALMRRSKGLSPFYDASEEQENRQ